MAGFAQGNLRQVAGRPSLRAHDLCYRRALAPRGATRPGFCQKRSAHEIEGVGNAGCPWHPQACARLSSKKHTSKRVPRNHPAFPHAMVLTVSFVLPGDRALLPPSSADMFLSKPGWADLNSANLTPASGRQDHTTSPYAATSFVSSPFDRSRSDRRESTLERITDSSRKSR